MIDVATLLCVLVKYAVAKLHMLLPKCVPRVDWSSSYDKDVPFFVPIFENPAIHITTRQWRNKDTRGTLEFTKFGVHPFVQLTSF